MGNTYTGYTSDKSLTFSGANISGGGNNPTCSDKTIADVNFGTATIITFASGVATSTMKLYKEESVSIDVTDGSVSSAGDPSYGLNVAVSSSLSGMNIQINSNDAYTTSKDTTLILSATGVSQMKFSNGNTTYSSYEAYGVSKSWDITDAAYGGNSSEGTKAVYVIYKDVYGNESSPVSDSITYAPIKGGLWPQDSHIWLLSSPPLDEPEISNETQSSEEEAGQQQQQEQEEQQQQTPSTASTPIFVNNLAFGSRGVDVAILQDKLKELGFFPQDVSSSGYFGPITKEAVMKFQKSVGIYPCGIVGPRTRKALNEQEFISNNDYIFTQDLSYGSRGEEVKQIQTRLRDQNFFPYWIKSTGWFGPVTQMAVKLFQKFCNLPQTGFVGKLTRAMLNR